MISVYLDIRLCATKFNMRCLYARSWLFKLLPGQ
eukprot:SAG11_NODE_7_length_31267_cov_19.541966_5_plen_34_part_00